MGESRTKAQENLKADIAIIGGGGGGLAAAVAAAEKGAKIVLLEKRRKAGGDTALAGGIFAVGSSVQRRLRTDAREDEYIKAAISYSHWKTDPRIVRAFVYKSGDTIDWLEKMGVKFEEIGQYLPIQGPRIFHLPRGLGAAVVKVLAKKCQDLGVRLLYETAAKRILTGKSGNVTGILAIAKEKELRITAKSVIIASGGYAGNKELLKKYYPFYTEGLRAIGLPHMGDGLLMAIEIGAATEGLGTLLLRGPYFPGSMDVIHVAMEPNTIWVNNRGERFVDEMTGFNWPEAANALNRQPDKISYALFDEKIKQSFIEEGLIKGYREPPLTKLAKLGERLQGEADKGRVKISNSWEEIAKWIGADPKTLKSTIDEYNFFCNHGYDEDFFKDSRVLVPIQTPPYYALKCYQGFLGTIGGIKINYHMQILNQQDDPIPGLYGAGSVAGGWESDTYCLQLSGSAFGFALNSGRIAGENAAQHGARK
jgi:fumarate reductase flavoprotein subunit